MKSKLCFFILLFYGLYVQAQERPDFEKKVRFGIKTGINASIFTRKVMPTSTAERSDFSNFNSFVRSSINAGLTADGRLTERISLTTELLFNSRGMVYKEKNNSVTIIDEEGEEQQAYNNFNFNIDYVELPIVINYNFKPSSFRIFLAAYAGLAPGIAVNSKTKLHYDEGVDGNGREAKNEILPLKNVKHFNNSLLAGVKLGDNSPRKINFYADFRLSYTLLPVFSRTVSDNGSNLDTRMLTGSVGVGVKF
ncbi:porin family protein [Pedobacter sp. B4-66]|uniref:porin family protein n=1 Tax=Pedobacter sp. B4-66 TaxID=2817280 RepID=UPI001BD93002|nr:porin family protein [Pedobacter sp. B4-66]